MEPAGGKDFSNTAGEYHGFCTSDISKIDPGFGSPELLRDLVQDAHALNMRVLLDVQVNHVCAKGMKYKANPTVEKVSKCITETEMAYWGLDRGYPLIPSENRQSLVYSDLPKYLQHESFFVRCGPKAMYRPNGQDFIKLGLENVTSIDAGFVFPEFFSNSYFELNTMDTALQELYGNLLKYWIAFADIDGYRVSAAAHITADFSSYLATTLRFYAAALGKENFFAVGEVQQSTSPFGFMHVGKVQPPQGPTYLPKRVQGVMDEICPYYSALSSQMPGFLSTYPVQESFLVREIAAGSSKPMDLYEREDWHQSVMRSRGTLQTQGDISLTMIAAESKDMPRLLSQQGSHHAEDVWRLQVALAWSFTWYGIPEIYNGAEMGLNGVCFRDREERERRKAGMVADGMKDEVAETILAGCDYTTLATSMNSGYWRQDMFSRGPFRLGSAVPSIQQQAGGVGKQLCLQGSFLCMDLAKVKQRRTISTYRLNF